MRNASYTGVLQPSDISIRRTFQDHGLSFDRQRRHDFFDYRETRTDDLEPSTVLQLRIPESIRSPELLHRHCTTSTHAQITNCGDGGSHTEEDLCIDREVRQCYAEFSVSCPAVAETIASTHCTYPRTNGQAE